MTAVPEKNRKKVKRDVVFPLVNGFILCMLMFITLFPVLNTVAISFNDGIDAVRGGIGLWPRQFSIEAYKSLLSDKLTYNAFGISVARTVITTVLNIFFTSMLAFALSRKEYIFRKFITLAVVLTMYVNAGLIPNFLLIHRTLKLSKSFWVYIIPTMFSCFNMIVIRTYIIGLPEALTESARIDGANDLRIFWQIIFPLCMPVLATVALFVAVGSWNQWFDTQLYNGSKKYLYTLQYLLKMKLATSMNTTNAANTSVDALANSSAAKATPVTVRCAITVVSALPILIVYPFLQRYFVTGMVLGGVKG